MKRMLQLLVMAGFGLSLGCVWQTTERNATPEYHAPGERPPSISYAIGRVVSCPVDGIMLESKTGDGEKSYKNSAEQDYTHVRAPFFQRKFKNGPERVTNQTLGWSKREELTYRGRVGDTVHLQYLQESRKSVVVTESTGNKSQVVSDQAKHNPTTLDLEIKMKDSQVVDVDHYRIEIIRADERQIVFKVLDDQNVFSER